MSNFPKFGIDDKVIVDGNANVLFEVVGYETRKTVHGVYTEYHLFHLRDGCSAERCEIPEHRLSLAKKADAKCNLEPKRVIFNPPATVVLWEDGTRTVVKVHNEPFDCEKGLAMAILRRDYGSGIRKLFKTYCGE